MTTLYMVVPCYNGNWCLMKHLAALKKICSFEKSWKIDEKSRVVYVNDGSRDSTWEKFKKNMRLTRCLVGSISHVTEAIKMRSWRV